MELGLELKFEDGDRVGIIDGMKLGIDDGIELGSTPT